MYQKLLSFALALTLCAPLCAADDVTSQYLTNASFEADDASSLSEVTSTADGRRGWTLTQPTGWTVSGTSVTQLLVSADCYADNNFGLITTIPDGTYAYYLRMGWSTGATTLTQTTGTLPAGRYRLSLDQRTGYANSATSSFSVSIGGETTTESFAAGSSGIFASTGWTTTSVAFTLDSDAAATISISINWLSGGSCIMLDNVRLYRLADDEDPSDDPTEADAESPTEGVITSDFVEESVMMDDLLQMLANFTTYIKNDYKACTYPNSLGEECGCFMGENTMANDERGVRPNADLSMICAFLVKYGKGKVTLPSEVSWSDLEDMAMKTLVFAYSTHKANKLKVCSGGNYWGSTSTSDYVWESSLWAMSVAYSAFFQWDKLSDDQKGYVEALLKAECNYELYRSIPTGYSGDTKAEENGWEADVLAATLGLFPTDGLASSWFERLRQFAINSYSHINDKTDATVVDPDYDTKTVADLYAGQNLYSDYTLQNHNLFHTSYQNVVMQELGEAALALKLFQSELSGKETWATNALMHNNQEVMDSVLVWLALADGELAMPNGNDWSLFLYDQITSYTTQACFQRDANALLLENLAYKQIKARQTTTSDGSWLLNADVGARRMGVEAHRVMMTWLMHHVASTADLAAPTWDEFNQTYAEAKVLPCQNVVRAATDSRFTCFSWSTGLKSYTGYFAANCPDKNKIVVPFRANNTGNLLGWYTLDGKSTNATPVVSGTYALDGNAYTMNGEINTNDAALNNRFCIYSTPSNAVIYIDHVLAKASATITKEQGGLLGISTDPFTKSTRTIYHNGTHTTSNGASTKVFDTNYANIDNQLGILTNGTQMAFGDRSLNNSIYTAKFSPLYSAESRTVATGDTVGKRVCIYYSLTDAETTAALAEQLQCLGDRLPKGWNGVIAPETDQSNHLLLSNFRGTRKASLTDISCSLGAPLLADSTVIENGKASASFTVNQGKAYARTLDWFVTADSISVISDGDTLRLNANETADAQAIGVSKVENGEVLSASFDLPTQASATVWSENGELKYSINDPSTGVANPKTASDATEEAGYVSLSGIRHAQPTHNGIYVHGQKKVLVKGN